MLTDYIQLWFRKKYLQTSNDFIQTASDRSWLPNLPQPGGSKLPDFAAFSYSLNFLIIGEAKTFSELYQRKNYGDVALKHKADIQIKTYLDFLNKPKLKKLNSLFVLAVPCISYWGVFSYLKNINEFKDILVISKSIKE